MRNVFRLAAAVVLTIASLAFTAAPSESNHCVWCVQQGNCLICHDSCTGTCTYSCEPGGDGYC